LQQQRRLADAGIAGDQQRRAWHQAAAGHPVELADAGAASVRALDRTGERREHQATLRPARRRPLRAVARGLLDQRVPGAAGIAAAAPLRMRRPALLTDVDAGSSHELSGLKGN
jgi:hypothetical protein